MKTTYPYCAPVIDESARRSDPWTVDSDAEPERPCDHPGCAGEGVFRAPKARDRLREYWWFCLEHVRAYNASWNYYAGMSGDEIERDRRRDTVWRRPSWPLSGAARYRRHDIRFDDGFGIFADGEEYVNRGARTPHWPPGSAEARALGVLGLAGDVSLADVRERYRKLVKRHHPDANGGCKAAEERLKTINEAYMTLVNALGA